MIKFKILEFSLSINIFVSSKDPSLDFASTTLSLIIILSELLLFEALISRFINKGIPKELFTFRPKRGLVKRNSPSILS